MLETDASTSHIETNMTLVVDDGCNTGVWLDCYRTVVNGNSQMICSKDINQRVDEIIDIVGNCVALTTFIGK